MKFAIVISHPIQYLVPFFGLLAKEPTIDLTVFFTWDYGVRKTYDEQFRTTVQWDIPLLEGYTSKFLKNYSPKPSSKFFGQINPGIIQEIRKGKFDAILLYGWNSFTNWMAFFTAIASKTKIFLRGESPLTHELLKPRWKQVFKRFLFKTLFKKVSIFLYIGEENRKFYKHYGVPDEKLFFIPYAVDNERLMQSAGELRPRRKQLRKKLFDITDDQAVILFVGKLIEKKRPLDLLKAYEMVKSPDKKLVFVGDGSLREELERYTRENKVPGVHFEGFKNQTELPLYYAVSDVFVLPSGLGETWGLVVNEAMCFGLPIIISDIVGCSPDLVEQKKNGFVFPCGDVRKLAACIELFVRDKKMVKRFGDRSFEIVQKYSFKIGAKRFVEAYSVRSFT